MLRMVIAGTKDEIRRWIKRQERLTGRKINYVMTEVDTKKEEYFCYTREGTKENCPRIRTVRKMKQESEKVSE